MFVLQDANALLAYEVGKVLIENAHLRMENARLQNEAQQRREAQQEAPRE